MDTGCEQDAIVLLISNAQEEIRGPGIRWRMQKKKKKKIKKDLGENGFPNRTAIRQADLMTPKSGKQFSPSLLVPPPRPRDGMT